MKRGQPLKRTTPLKRGAGLKRTASTTAVANTSFVSGPLKRGKRKSKAKVPEQVRGRVMRRSGGKCVRPGCGEKAVHVHHVLDENRWPAVAKVEANLVGVCFQCHWDHHFKPDGELPWEAIPSAAHQLAAGLGPAAQAHLERNYPQDPDHSIGRRLSN